MAEYFLHVIIAFKSHALKNNYHAPYISSIVLQKVQKQGIRFWDKRTFWHEIIYKSLIPTLGNLATTEVSQK